LEKAFNTVLPSSEHGQTTTTTTTTTSSLIDVKKTNNITASSVPIAAQSIQNQMNTLPTNGSIIDTIAS
jgi:hypothetical protein